MDFHPRLFRHLNIFDKFLLLLVKLHTVGEIVSEVLVVLRGATIISIAAYLFFFKFAGRCSSIPRYFCLFYSDRVVNLLLHRLEFPLPFNLVPVSRLIQLVLDRHAWMFAFLAVVALIKGIWVKVR